LREPEALRALGLRVVVRLRLAGFREVLFLRLDGRRDDVVLRLDGRRALVFRRVVVFFRLVGLRAVVFFRPRGAVVFLRPVVLRAPVLREDFLAPVFLLVPVVDRPPARAARFLTDSPISSVFSFATFSRASTEAPIALCAALVERTLLPARLPARTAFFTTAITASSFILANGLPGGVRAANMG
jgi:hypothetical protein